MEGGEGGEDVGCWFEEGAAGLVLWGSLVWCLGGGREGRVICTMMARLEKYSTACVSPKRGGFVGFDDMVDG